MIPFPAWDLPKEQLVIKKIGDERVLEVLKVKVYCSCRMPEMGREKMAQCAICQEWYHQNCEKIPSVVFSRGKRRISFICENCQ